MILAFHAESLLRICVGTVLGGVIGYERDLHGRPAGLRTHTLVALAASTFMVVSTRFVYFQGYGHDDMVSVDSSRIAASVVSGIGFLAGGAILRTGVTIQGLTTAAGLWLVAAIGLAAGGGMFVEAGLVTLLGVGALTVLRRFEDKDDRSVRRKLELTLVAGAPSVSAIVAQLVALGVTVSQEEYERDLARGEIQLTLDLRMTAALGVEAILEKLETQAGITKVRLQPSL